MDNDRNGKQEQLSDRRDIPAPPRDLVDFHVRWREFRPLAESAAKNTCLRTEEISTLRWLILLADRVREQDI